MRLPQLRRGLPSVRIRVVPANLRARASLRRLRKALDQQLPSAISWRRDKKGFSVPHTQWMLESSAYWQELLLSKAHLDASNLIDQNKLLAQLPRIFSSGSHTEELEFVFRYGCYLLWLERFDIRLVDAS